MQLPKRQGPNPKTTSTNPHQQLDQNPPAEIYKKLKELAFNFPHVERRASIISVPGAEALWLNEDAPVGPTEAVMMGREFAHVHPAYDGSLHLILPRSAVSEVLEKGWGELHPVARMGIIPPTTLMIYGPRNEDELSVILQILKVSYEYASGSATSL